jgi:hypothetical protein
MPRLQALGSVIRENVAPVRALALRIDLPAFSSLLKERLRKMHADPAIAWHHAVWDLEAARLLLRSGGGGGGPGRRRRRLPLTRPLPAAAAAERALP